MKYERDLTKKLYRIPQNGYLGGVCGGVARYFGISPLLVRFLFLIALIASGILPMLLLYILLFFVFDPLPHDYGRHNEIEDKEGYQTKPMHLIKNRFAKLEQKVKNLESYIVSEEFELECKYKKL